MLSAIFVFDEWLNISHLTIFTILLTLVFQVEIFDTAILDMETTDFDAKLIHVQDSGNFKTTGAGTVHTMYGDFTGKITVDGTANLRVNRFEMRRECTLLGVGTISVDDTFHWYGGNLTGSGNLRLYGFGTIPEDIASSDYGRARFITTKRVFSIYGTFLWGGGDVSMASQAKWEVKEFGYLRLAPGGNLIDTQPATSGSTLVVSGTLTKEYSAVDNVTVGPSKMDVSMTVSSTGVVDVLQDCGNLQITRGEITGSVYVASGGNAGILCTAPPSSVVNAANLVKAVNFRSQSLFNSSGLLKVSGCTMGIEGTYFQAGDIELVSGALLYKPSANMETPIAGSLVTVDGGTLTVENLALSSPQVNLNGGALKVDGDLTVNTPDGIAAIGGTHTISGRLAIQGDFFIDAAPKFYGGGTIEILGSTTFQGGLLSTNIIRCQGSFTMLTTTAKKLETTRLILEGTSTWTAGDLVTQYGSTIIVPVGSTFTMAPGGDLLQLASLDGVIFTVEGTVFADPGAAVVRRIQAFMNIQNGGSFQALTGTLYLEAGGSVSQNSSEIAIPETSSNVRLVVRFANDTLTFEDNALLSVSDVSNTFEVMNSAKVEFKASSVIEIEGGSTIIQTGGYLQLRNDVIIVSLGSSLVVEDSGSTLDFGHSQVTPLILTDVSIEIRSGGTLRGSSVDGVTTLTTSAALTLRTGSAVLWYGTLQSQGVVDIRGGLHTISNFLMVETSSTLAMYAGTLKGGRLTVGTAGVTGPDFNWFGGVFESGQLVTVRGVKMVISYLPATRSGSEPLRITAARIILDPVAAAGDPHIWTDGDIQVTNAAEIIVSTGAQFNVHPSLTDINVVDTYVVGERPSTLGNPSKINIFGLVEKWGTATTEFQFSTNNYGKLCVRQGNLILGAGSDKSYGEWCVDASAVLTFSDINSAPNPKPPTPLYDLISPGSIVGSGSVEFIGGQINLAILVDISGDVTVDGTVVLIFLPGSNPLLLGDPFRIDGGTVDMQVIPSQVPPRFLINGGYLNLHCLDLSFDSIELRCGGIFSSGVVDIQTFQWSGGTMSGLGQFTVVDDLQMTLNAANPACIKKVDRMTVIAGINSSALWTGGNLLGESGGTLRNEASLFHVQPTAGVIQMIDETDLDGKDAFPRLENAFNATFRISGATMETTGLKSEFFVHNEPGGIIRVSGGLFEVAGGGLNDLTASILAEGAADGVVGSVFRVSTSSARAFELLSGSSLVVESSTGAAPASYFSVADNGLVNIDGTHNVALSLVESGATATYYQDVDLVNLGLPLTVQNHGVVNFQNLDVAMGNLVINPNGLAKLLGDVKIDELEMNGGVLDGSFDFFAKKISFNSGVMSGSGRTVLRGDVPATELIMDSTSMKILTGRTLEIEKNGLFSWKTGDFSLRDGALLLVSGTLNIQPSSNPVQLMSQITVEGAANPLVTIEGPAASLEVLADSADVEISAFTKVSEASILRVHDNSKLTLFRGSQIIGNVQIDLGATLVFDGARHTFEASSLVSGLGTTEFKGSSAGEDAAATVLLFGNFAPTNVLYDSYSTTNVFGTYNVAGTSTLAGTTKCKVVWDFNANILSLGGTKLLVQAGEAVFSFTSQPSVAGVSFSSLIEVTDSGILNLGTLPIALDSLVLNGASATVLVGGDFTVFRSFEFRQGTLTGRGGRTLIADGATLTFIGCGGSACSISGSHVVENLENGAIRWTGGGKIFASDGATIINDEGAVFDIELAESEDAEVRFYSPNVGLRPVIQNRGNLTIDVASCSSPTCVTVTIQAYLQNDASGYVLVNNGRLMLSGGSDFYGDLTLDNLNSELAFTGGSNIVRQSSSVGGVGQIRFSGAAVESFKMFGVLNPSLLFVETIVGSSSIVISGEIDVATRTEVSGTGSVLRLEYGSTYTSFGTQLVVSNGRVELLDLPVPVLSDIDIVSSGLLQFGTQPVTIAGVLTVDGATASIKTDGTVTLEGEFVWRQGVLSGSGIIVLDSPATATGPNHKQLTSLTILVKNTFVWDEGRMIWEDGCTFENVAGNTITFDASSAALLLDFSNVGKVGLLNNFGVIDKIGPNPVTISAFLSNANTLNIVDGQCSLDIGSETVSSITIASGAFLVFEKGDHVLSKEGAVSGAGTLFMGSTSSTGTNSMFGAIAVPTVELRGSESYFFSPITGTTFTVSGSGYGEVLDEYNVLTETIIKSGELEFGLTSNPISLGSLGLSISGGTIRFLQLNDGALVHVEQTGGSVDFSRILATIGSYTQSAATSPINDTKYIADGEVTVGGPMLLQGGQVMGNGITFLTKGAIVTGETYATGHILTNLDVFEWRSGDMFWREEATLISEAGGTFLIDTEEDLFLRNWGDVLPAPFVTNNGLMLKQGAGIVEFQSYFTNNLLTKVDGGRLRFCAGGENNGAFNSTVSDNPIVTCGTVDFLLDKGSNFVVESMTIGSDLSSQADLFIMNMTIQNNAVATFWSNIEIDNAVFCCGSKTYFHANVTIFDSITVRDDGTEVFIFYDSGPQKLGDKMFLEGGIFHLQSPLLDGVAPPDVLQTGGTFDMSLVDTVWSSEYVMDVAGIHDASLLLHGRLSVTGILRLKGGNVQGAGGVIAAEEGGVIYWEGPNDKYAEEVRFEIHANSVGQWLDTGDMLWRYGAMLAVEEDGLFIVQTTSSNDFRPCPTFGHNVDTTGSDDLSPGAYLPETLQSNVPVVRVKQGGLLSHTGDCAVIHVRVELDGTLDVNSSATGRLALAGSTDVSVSGLTLVAVGKRLEFAGGSEHLWREGASLSGLGTIAINEGANVHLLGTVSSDFLEVAQGAILRVHGHYSPTSTVVSGGAIRFANSSTIADIAGSSLIVRDGGKVDVYVVPTSPQSSVELPKTFTVDGGLVNLASGIFEVANFNLIRPSASALPGSGDRHQNILQVNGTLAVLLSYTWEAGLIAGSGKELSVLHFPATTSGTLSSTSAKFLREITLTNEGTMNWEDGNMNLQVGASIRNDMGTITIGSATGIQNNAMFLLWSDHQDRYPTFENKAGSVVHLHLPSANTHRFEIEGLMQNFGDIVVEGDGTLCFSEGGRLAHHDGATLTLQGSSVLEFAGTLATAGEAIPANELYSGSAVTSSSSSASIEVKSMGSLLIGGGAVIDVDNLQATGSRSLMVIAGDLLAGTGTSVTSSSGAEVRVDYSASLPINTALVATGADSILTIETDGFDIDSLAVRQGAAASVSSIVHSGPFASSYIVRSAVDLFDSQSLLQLDNVRLSIVDSSVFTHGSAARLAFLHESELAVLDGGLAQWAGVDQKWVDGGVNARITVQDGGELRWSDGDLYWSFGGTIDVHENGLLNLNPVSGGTRRLYSLGANNLIASGRGDPQSQSLQSGLLVDYWSGMGVDSNFIFAPSSRSAVDLDPFDGTQVRSYITGSSNGATRYVGFITPPASGYYQFRAVHLDGIRLWVDTEEQVLDDWSNRNSRSPSTTTATRNVYLEKGTYYPIETHFFHTVYVQSFYPNSQAYLELLWAMVSCEDEATCSPSSPFSRIPMSAFYHQPSNTGSSHDQMVCITIYKILSPFCIFSFIYISDRHNEEIPMF